MRSLIRHGLVLGSCLVAMVASSGCTAKKQTEYVGGISTQLQVPRDVKAVRVSISVGGAQVFCGGYKVYNGVATLPKSLGSYAVNETSQTVRYEIAALSQEFDSANNLFSACDINQVGKDNIRVLRSSTQPYIPERILFLPLPLKYACYDVDCSKTPGQTCKAGQCVDDSMSMADAAKLPDFVDGMGEGTDGACFATGLCMGAAIPAIPLGTTSPIAGSAGCDFVLPETADSGANGLKLDPPAATNPFRPACKVDADCGPTGRKCGTTTPLQCDLLPPGSPPWTGLNVEISFDGGRTKEILDNDPFEGFSIPDPVGKPQTFRLAPGLCDMYKGTAGAMHRITGVRASGTCGPKSAAQSICQVDALALQGLDQNGKTTAASNDVACTSTALTPTPAALVVVVDNTAGFNSLYNTDSITNFQAPLTDPAFTNTQFALMFSGDGAATNACSASKTPAVPLQSPVTGVTAIRTALSAFTPGGTGVLSTSTDPDFSGALESSYKYLNQNSPDLVRRAVLVVGNRQFNTNTTCGPEGRGTPPALATAALAGNPIYTYVLEPTSDKDMTGGAEILAAAGLSNPPPTTITQYNPAPVGDPDTLASFEKIVDLIATCAYDVPAGITAPTNTDVLSYVDPLTNTQQPGITFNEACSKDDPTAAGASGWGTDGKHIFVCGAACSTYRATLAQAAKFGILYKQPALAVPLYVGPAVCATK